MNVLCLRLGLHVSYFISWCDDQASIRSHTAFYRLKDLRVCPVQSLRSELDQKKAELN